MQVGQPLSEVCYLLPQILSGFFGSPFQELNSVTRPDLTKQVLVDMSDLQNMRVAAGGLRVLQQDKSRAGWC